MTRPASGNDPDADPDAYDFEVPPHPTTDAEIAALPTLDLADFRQWLINNGGMLRAGLDAASITDTEVEERLAAAHAEVQRRETGEGT